MNPRFPSLAGAVTVQWWRLSPHLHLALPNPAAALLHGETEKVSQSEQIRIATWWSAALASQKWDRDPRSAASEPDQEAGSTRAPLMLSQVQELVELCARKFVVRGTPTVLILPL